MTSYRNRSYIFLLLVAIIWGAASPVIKFTLQGIDPLPFLAYRFAISAAFAFIFLSIKGFHFKKMSHHTPAILGYGVLAFPVALLALFMGLDNSTVLDLNLIVAAAPLLVSLGGAYLFHDKITKRERLGTTVVLVGAILAALSPIFTSEAEFHLTGNLFLIIYLLADAAAVLISKALTRHKVEPATLTSYGFLIAAAILIPIAYLGYDGAFIQSIVSLPFVYHLGVWYMALVSGTLAYFLWVSGQKSIEISEAGLFSYLIPVFSTPLAIVWLGEQITTIFIISAIVIASGIIVAEKK